jgi:hypothetical protein
MQSCHRKGNHELEVGSVDGLIRDCGKRRNDQFFYVFAAELLLEYCKPSGEGVF